METATMRSGGARAVAAAVWTVALLAGCSTTMAGSRGRIREIRAEEAAECKYLGVVESSERSGWSMSDDEMGAMAHVRKRIASMGGNAYVLTHGDPARSGVVVRADVYRCR